MNLMALVMPLCTMCVLPTIFTHKLATAKNRGGAWPFAGLAGLAMLIMPLLGLLGWISVIVVSRLRPLESKPVGLAENKRSEKVKRWEPAEDKIKFAELELAETGEDEEIRKLRRHGLIAESRAGS
jgi:hypothetical protein